MRTEKCHEDVQHSVAGAHRKLLQHCVGRSRAAIDSKTWQRNAIERHAVHIAIERRLNPKATAATTSNGTEAATAARRRTLLWRVHRARAKATETRERADATSVAGPTQPTELLCAGAASTPRAESLLSEWRREGYVDIWKQCPESLLPILIHQLMIAKTPQTRKIREMIHASGMKHTGNSAVIGTHLNLQPPMIAVHVMEEMELARKLLKPLWLILRARGAHGIGRIWKAAGFMTLMSLNLPCAVRVLRILQVIERT